ncbi:ash family protein [Escherichia coli]|uniref:ash family protein n=1 Tax=Escherichia coli TaxID=562 RepID=UPI0004535F94|nr:ash family protein [Escherichia coli]EED1397447.1 ash family protein [Escherichia coli]EEV6494946.1 ash family protein [Escherichia coli]EGT1034733.1 ash family protein [Escherichia coli]EHO4880909.1 ash family protein [Escherichia coli]EJN3875157.1 ash family protein [Escherichia coli]
MATIQIQKRPKFAIPQLNCDCRCSKKSLHSSGIAGYSHCVAANSATGLRIPQFDTVQQHAPEACFLLPGAPHSMVARAGASSEAPGFSVSSGNANPVRAATNGFASVDGSEKLYDTEAV